MTFVFYPTDSMADFYTSFDFMTLIDVLKTTLQFLNLNWNMANRPTLCLYLTESRLKLVCPSNLPPIPQIIFPPEETTFVSL